MSRKLPVVIILGATACGKSKLAIDIARRFNGEIISADSMQVYHDLDIVTNKVTKEEQAQAKHHMIDFLNPIQRFSVVDYRDKSLAIIDQLLESNRLPIVVGGTNYYIESILWKSFIIAPFTDSLKRSVDGEPLEKTLIDAEASMLGSAPKDTLHTEEDLDDVKKFLAKPIYAEGFVHVDSERLWRLLEKIDTRSAHIYHPHDKRRIIRCLQVIQKRQKNFSDVIDDFNKTETSEKSSLGGPLRYENCCVLWLSCDNELLHKILDERVDQMLEKGLLSELESFHEEYNKQRFEDGIKPDYQKGIFQTIGFKEFHRYLIMGASKKDSSEGKKILENSIREMKLSTRNYAKRQLRWIRRRFLQSGTRDLPPIFKIDSVFDEQQWDTQVREPAFKIINSFLEDKPLSAEVLALRQHPSEHNTSNKPAKFFCEPCDRTFIGSNNIGTHLRSKIHERRLKYVREKRRRLVDDITKVVKATAVEE